MAYSPLLEGKSAVVFGAGGSIGAAVAKEFAAEGAEVFLCGRSAESIEVIAKEISATSRTAHPIVVDAFDPDAVDQVMKSVVEKTGQRRYRVQRRRPPRQCLRKRQTSDGTLGHGRGDASRNRQRLGARRHAALGERYGHSVRADVQRGWFTRSVRIRDRRFEGRTDHLVQPRARIAGMRVEPAPLRSRSSRRSSSFGIRRRSSSGHPPCCDRLWRHQRPETPPTWIGPSPTTRGGLARPTQAAIRHLKPHHRGHAQSPIETVQRTSPE